MTRAERNKIIKWASTLTDNQLKCEYYRLLFLSLGSQIEAMYDAGYDIQLIIEQEKYETYISQISDLLGMMCCERGIELSEEFYEQSKT